MKFIPFTSYDINNGSEICPVCNSNKSTEISNLDRRFKYLLHVKCETCALIRQMPLPSKLDLEEYYAEEYRVDYQNVSSEPTEKHRNKRLSEGGKRLGRLGKLISEIDTVLDFGCGSGEFIELCIQKNLTATGFEPGNGYAEYARSKRNLNVISGASHALKFEERFDLITTFHVFEHLVDPLKKKKKMQLWLKPQGKIFLETPNLKNALYKGFGCLHFAHTLGFSRYSMEYLGATAGLKVNRVFDDFDIGILFEIGTPRPLEIIAKDAIEEMNGWSKSKIHKQFWRYSFSKLTGKNFRPSKVL